MLLKFRLDKDGLSVINPQDLHDLSAINCIKCNFDIKDRRWNCSDAIVAIFKSASYNKVQEVILDSSHSCFMDSEIYKYGGVIQVKLAGDRYRSGHVKCTTQLTNIVELYINNGVIKPTPTPDKYEVVVAELVKAEKAVEAVIEDINRRAANGEFDGVGISNISYNSDGTLSITLTDGTSFVSPYSMKGEKGDKGDKGDVGETITNITYREDGHIVITTSDGNIYTSEYSMKGETGPAGPRGLQGPQGVAGPQGPQGPAGPVTDVKFDGVSTLNNGESRLTNAVAGIAYGTCNTASNTSVKQVTAPSDFKLRTGSIVTVLFSNQVLSAAQLKVNDSAARPIYWEGSPLPANPQLIFPNNVATFVYDAVTECYHLISVDTHIPRTAAQIDYDQDNTVGECLDTHGSRISALETGVYKKNDYLIFEFTDTSLEPQSKYLKNYTVDDLDDYVVISAMQTGLEGSTAYYRSSSYCRNVSNGTLSPSVFFNTDTNKVVIEYVNPTINTMDVSVKVVLMKYK